MAYIEKKNRWGRYLKHKITFGPLDWKKISYVAGGQIHLLTSVEQWLEENVGYTKDSPWHKNKFYPPKPKYIMDVEHIRYNGYYVTIAFYDEGDALAFKLTWD